MSQDPATRRENASLTRRLLLFTAGSFAFGFALVPLYDVICEAAGIRVNEAPSRMGESAAADRKVALEFVSIVAPGGEWELIPETRQTVVQPGRLHEAKFVIRSRAAVPVTGQAVPSVAPSYTAKYLQKTECFCFTPQDFAPAEQREFTVRFIVDPDLPPQVDRMTLAYSMYTLPERKLAAR
ncbi:MAG: cytochrome c oxidase assembly protein subunit 11 [Pseudomonadota bacterium]|nr:cytochrome c oxidase assembly protein subunit 11 [Pseudomonadota bacterium]